MAKQMGVSEIEEFLNGPLVTWFSSCLESPAEEKLTYDALVDGVLIHNVFLQMDLHCQEGAIVPTNDDSSLRLRNLRKVLRNLRQFYEDELGHVILRMPDVSRLAKEPRLNVAEASLLLSLLLGCAVRCPVNDTFIARILRLDQVTQAAIADCIAHVVHVPDLVLSPDMLTMASDDEQLDEQSEKAHQAHLANVQKAFEHLRRINRERDVYRSKLRGMARCYNKDSTLSQLQLSSAMLIDEDDELELDSCCSIQEILDSSTRSDREEAQRRDAELLVECKTKLRREQEKLKEKSDDLHEARDELTQYRMQLTKLQKDNEILKSEVRSVKSYRDELDAANEKAERADRFEQEIARYKEKLADADFCKSRLNELREDNHLLIESKEMLAKQVAAYKVKAERVLDLEQQIFQLKQQLNELQLKNAASCDKYRELCEENAELERLVKFSTKEVLDSGFIMQDSDDSSIGIMDSSLSEQLTNSVQSQALKLELENRRLSNLVDSLKETSFHESSSKLLDLEKDKKKLCLTVDALKEDMKKLSRKNEELESRCKKALDEKERLKQDQVKDDQLSVKYVELEQKLTIVDMEKRRLRTLLDSLQEDSLDLEKKVMKDAVNETKIKQQDLESRIAILENEKHEALVEVEKERDLVKEKTLALNAMAKMIENLELKLQKLERQTDDSNLEVSKLRDLMDVIDNNTYNTAKFKNTPNNRTNNVTKDEAKLQTLIENFESQSQHCALKLTNSQLLAENEILLKSREKLSCDQEHLKALHDQLNQDYQLVLQERNQLRSQLREAKSKIRHQSESIETLESTSKHLEDECKGLKSNSLRLEHAELKEDFGKLYNANEALTMEYRKVKSELDKLTSSKVNHQEELKAKTMKVAELEVEVSKLEHRSEVLVQMNEGLEKDKRSLMDYITQLLKQNHELIGQSLDDREHYHQEERKNADKVNHLTRQKEKLEEKIMDHYKKQQSCPPKKKTGIVKSTFVKVRRAGSEFLNRSRRSWAEESMPAAERSYDFDFYTRSHESDVTLDDHRSRLARESTVSDYSCLIQSSPNNNKNKNKNNHPRNRKSVDFLENFSPADFTFDDNQEHLQSKSRKSLDFEMICSLYNKEENENEDGNESDELDKTLHESTNGDCAEGKTLEEEEEEDLWMFATNKSVDLSFEEESEETESAKDPKDSIEEVLVGDKKEELEVSKSRKSVWLEYGCV